MPRLPSPADYGTSLPRPSRGLTDIRAVQVEPDLATGKVMQEFGVMLAQEQEKLDTAKAEDALNKIKQARLDLTMGEGGAYGAKGGDVLTPTYMTGYKSRLDSTVESVLQGLTPQQRAKLKPHADSQVLGLQTDILRHSMTESEKYHGIVREGSITTETGIAIANRGDPLAVEASMTKLALLAETTAKAQGLQAGDKGAITALQQKTMSPALAGAITGLLDDRKIADARSLFDKHVLTIAPDTRLRLGEQIKKVEEAQTVQATAGSEVAKVATSNTTESRLSSVLTSMPLASIGAVESSGKHARPDGSITLGPVIDAGPQKGKRAVGKYQFLESTAQDAAKAAGIPWDKALFADGGRAGEDYHEKLAQAHLGRLTQKFADAAHIAAAWNAGEGNVQKADTAVVKVKKLWADGVEPVLPFALEQQQKAVRANAEAAYAKNPDKAALVDDRVRAWREQEVSFLDFLPKVSETKPYVEKAIALTKAMPDFVRPSEVEIQSRMAAKFPGRPDLAKEAAALATKRLVEVEAAQKLEVEKTKESLYKLMGGGKAFSELPPSMVGKLSVPEQDAMRETFNKHAESTPHNSDQNLLRQINGDPDYLARQSASWWQGPARTMLSSYDWGRFDKQRSARLGGDVKEVDTLDEGAVHRNMAELFRQLEIDPTPKENDGTGMATVNSARAVLDQSVLQKQRQLGRKMTDVELSSHVKEMFRTDVKLRSTFLGFDVGSTESKTLLAMNYSDVPDTAVASIKKMLAKEGLPKPTNTQILTRYKMLRMPH